MGRARTRIGTRIGRRLLSRSAGCRRFSKLGCQVRVRRRVRAHDVSCIIRFIISCIFVLRGLQTADCRLPALSAAGRGRSRAAPGPVPSLPFPLPRPLPSRPRPLPPRTHSPPLPAGRFEGARCRTRPLCCARCRDKADALHCAPRLAPCSLHLSHKQPPPLAPQPRPWPRRDSLPAYTTTPHPQLWCSRE